MRQILWYVMNVTFLVSILAAAIGKIELLQVLITTFTWILASLVPILLTPEGKLQLKQFGRAVPLWEEAAYDILVLIILIHYGWWATLVGYSIVTAIQYRAMELALK